MRAEEGARKEVSRLHERLQAPPLTASASLLHMPRLPCLHAPFSLPRPPPLCEAQGRGRCSQTAASGRKFPPTTPREVTAGAETVSIARKREGEESA